MENKLVEVRCPFKRKLYKNGAGPIITCNKLCLKVYPPSSGEVKCMTCKLTFEFDVTNQSIVNTQVRMQNS